MEKLIKEVYEIIKDYRHEDGLMSESIVKDWINQFDESDRMFVLEEMKNILQKRYISKEKAKNMMKGMIEFLAEKFEFKNPKDYLLECNFIDNQHEGKSQKVLLQFLDEIINEEYGIGVLDCNSKKPKFYIYIDDVFCTGDTFVKNMTRENQDDKGWFHQTDENGKTNLELFRENNSKLVLSYFSIHLPNVKKAQNRIFYELKRESISYVYAWDEEYEIDRSFNSDSKMNFLFPKEDLNNKLVTECKSQIETKIHDAGYHKDESITFRAENKPDKEEFFSSAENRDRFEKIILKKSIEIYNTSPRLMHDLRPRPLGYGLYTDLNLGFGTLIFTWRNVPYNVPLVFWYKSRYWKPLFERNHT